MKDNLITMCWVIILALVLAILICPRSQEVFRQLTIAYPYLMGFIKVGLLGTMGELLGGRIVTGKWKLKGVRLAERFLVWAALGVVFTVIFPIFSFGVDGILAKGLIQGKGTPLLEAFWKSFFMNMVFAFPMMSFHRLTDTAIDGGGLFRKWNIPATFRQIDWDNMFKLVGLAILWFWIPAQTVTFSLPAEFRVMSAALLAIALGIIMGVAKKISLKKNESAGFLAGRK
ncbi:MAG: hypothetical protein K9M99_07920 [Candidatus Cloacimonetes bacterium]|nr:hypothetical protein [Candidatus Cloacimonadota bacterium]